MLASDAALVVSELLSRELDFMLHCAVPTAIAALRTASRPRTLGNAPKDLRTRYATVATK